MQELFVLVLVGCTSIGAYVVGARGFGLTRERLRAAIGKMLIYLGATLVFFGVNLGVGVLVVLAGRTLAIGFLSMYLSNDVSILVLSAIQGLTFTCWREC